MRDVLPELYRIGFRFEYNSDNRWDITGVPSFLKNKDTRDVVKKMIEAVDDTNLNYGRGEQGLEELWKKLALVMARSGAVNYGQKLTTEEMDHILGRLFSLNDPSYTPNGNKIYQLIDSSTVEGFFK